MYTYTGEITSESFRELLSDICNMSLCGDCPLYNGTEEPCLYEEYVANELNKSDIMNKLLTTDGVIITEEKWHTHVHYSYKGDK